MELSETLALRNILIFSNSNISTVLITNILRQNHVITKDQCKELLKLNSRVRQQSVLNDYIDKIGNLTSFKNFTRALRNAGYTKLCNQLLDEHSRLTKGTTHDVEKNTLKYERAITKFYVDMKIKADSDNQIESGKPYLKRCVCSLDAEIEKLGRGNKPARVQLLFDMRIVIYTLLSQKYSDIRKREQVLLKMQYDHPDVKDTKLYDVLFPSGLSIICAADGKSPAKHDEQVETVVESSSSAFLAILANLAKLYKNDICQQKFDLKFTDHTKEAKKVYETCLQLTNEFTDEECRILRTVINLERAHALLGINWNFQICDIQNITTKNLKQARDILNDLVEPEVTRRKLWYFMCKGRQYELCDILMAKRYVHRAYECAVDKSDKSYIKQYLTFLACEKRPRLVGENVDKGVDVNEKYNKQRRVLREGANKEWRKERTYGKNVADKDIDTNLKYTRNKRNTLLNEEVDKAWGKEWYGKNIMGAVKKDHMDKSINNRFAYFWVLLLTIFALWCITLWF